MKHALNQNILIVVVIVVMIVCDVEEVRICKGLSIGGKWEEVDGCVYNNNNFTPLKRPLTTFSFSAYIHYIY